MNNAQKKGSPFIAIAIAVVVIGLAVGGVVMTAFTPMPVDEAGAYRVAGQLGFKDAKITARYGGQTIAWQHGCGEGEMSACDMEASDASGRPISFIVCCGGAAGRACNIRAKTH